MISSESVRAVRGILNGLAISFIFWAALVAAALYGQGWRL